MFKRILLLIISISFLLSQEQSITNISVAQQTNGSGIVDIFYDLNDDADIFPSFTIDVQISYDAGYTWQSANTSDLEGDFGEVTPGNAKHIIYHVPSGLYSNSVVIKLSGQGHFVTSDLPFTTVTINPETILYFESEHINYSFEIMQYELTNAQLVEWLETYSFESAGNYSDDLNDTADSEYYCWDNANYYFSDENPEDDQIWGCSNENALNYNPFASMGGDDCGICIFSDEDEEGYDPDYHGFVGCSDQNAFYESEFLGNNTAGLCASSGYFMIYHDCSCTFLESNMEPVMGYDIGGPYLDCDWESAYTAVTGNSYIPDSSFESYFGMYFNQYESREFNICADENALNYNADALQAIEDICEYIGYPCCSGVNQTNFHPNGNGGCVYECDLNGDGLSEGSTAD